MLPGNEWRSRPHTGETKMTIDFFSLLETAATSTFWIYLFTQQCATVWHVAGMFANWLESAWNFFVNEYKICTLQSVDKKSWEKKIDYAITSPWHWDELTWLVRCVAFHVSNFNFSNTFRCLKQNGQRDQELWRLLKTCSLPDWMKLRFPD